MPNELMTREEVLDALCPGLEPWQREALLTLMANAVRYGRARSVAFLPTGGSKSYLLSELAARGATITPAMLAERPAPVVSCVLRDECERAPARAGFDWRQEQRQAHKKTPRDGQARGVSRGHR